jgi:hypothetical protein
VTTQGVGWSFGEASDLDAPPLNLVLYTHLTIFVYTSNTLIASFEYTELILVSGTLKNFRFLLRSCLSTDRAPVIKLTCSTFQTCPCINVLMALRRETYWFSAVLLTLITDVGNPFVFQNTKDPVRITHGWEDLYSIRSHPLETFLYDCLLWNTLFDSSIFYRCEGANHLTGSCRVPYRILCQIQIRYILEFGCNVIQYSLETFLD